MKKTILKYASMLMTVLIVSSCSDSYLEVKPRGTELTDNYYINADQALTGLIAVYDQVGGSANDYANKFIVAILASDDCYGGGGTKGDQSQLQVMDSFQCTEALGSHTSLWDRGFSGVFRANAILDQLPDVPMDDNLRSQYIAEAKFLRAYFYFDLVRFFENIPLMTSTEIGDFKTVEQVDPSKVFEQIKTDLIEAIVNLPSTIDLEKQGGRATKAAGYALLGRVHLWLGEYPDAATQLKEVNGTPGGTSQFGNSLLPNFEDLWAFDNKHNSEAIFSVSHTSESSWDDWQCIACAEGNWINTLFNPRDYKQLDPSVPLYFSGWGFGPVTPNLESVLTGDPRYDATILNLQKLEEDSLASYNKNGYQNTGFFLKKFASLQSDASLTGNSFGNFSQNMYDIRLADTYLMEAEALVQSGTDATRAQALLDAIRSRVGLTSVPVTLASIKLERRLELAGEGHRWFDLIRWGDAEAALGSQGFIAGKNEILPIPLNDLQDTAIEQNLEYGGTK